MSQSFSLAYKESPVGCSWSHAFAALESSVTCGPYWRVARGLSLHAGWDLDLVQ